MTGRDDTPAVRVMIFGEEYQIRTDRPEAHTRACAEYVDELIRRAHVGGVAETHRAAVLAALQITDELLEERREAEALARTVEEGLTELAERLEGMVGAATEPGASPNEPAEGAEAAPA